MASSGTTGVYVHASRYPVRILRRLVTAAGPTATTTDRGQKGYVERLTPLFVYEAGYRPPGKSATPDGAAQSNATASSGQPGFSSAKSINAKSAPSSAAKAGHSFDNLDDEKEILTFESPVEGTLTEWNVKEGDILADPDQPILRILEPCKHPIQLMGLCAVCGKDLTSVDYTGFSETSRANIQMTHDSSHLMVSMEEAARLEKQTSERLLQEKKLSLIVDLDQTIIHTGVEPTIGEWMKDPKNPNHSVLQDVQSFRLMNERGVEDGTVYYVKPRPGFQAFLKACSAIFECHVYTMATRAYAENVCRIVDPDGSIFSNRILSRDESGSSAIKSLERLFPVDQSMVVIIDDRSDVWGWSPNLVKVIPYEFFIGAGDINGAFLPKNRSMLQQVKAPTSTAPSTVVTVEPIAANDPLETESDISAQEHEQNEVLDHQIHDKPLAKLQEMKSEKIMLDKEERDKERSSRQNSTVPPSSTSSADGATAAPLDLSDSVSKSNGSALSAEKVPAAANTNTNGIGRSKFVPKTVTNDDNSDSDTSSDDESDNESGDEDNKQGALSTIAAQASSLATLSAEDNRSGTAGDSNIAVSATRKTESLHSLDAEELSEVGESGEINDSAGPEEEEAVLQDTDRELDRVLEVLQQVHSRYYDEYRSSSGGVSTIIPEMKREVLRDCNLVFSSIIPLDQRPERSEVWQYAHQFGASCSNALQSRTTHLVAAKPDTTKVHAAQRRKGVYIVQPSWLYESVATWRRASEAQHQLEMPVRDDSIPSNVPSPSSFMQPQDPDPPDASTSSHAYASQTEDQVALADDNDLDADLNDIDWGDAAAEINAALDETDSEDDGAMSATIDDPDTDPDSRAAGAMARKRGRCGSGGHSNGRTTPVESPLAKRRKVAAARVGKSKLKMSESIDAISDDVPASETLDVQEATHLQKKRDLKTPSISSASQTSSPTLLTGEGGSGTGTDNDDDDDDLDDFAKALEGQLS